MMRAAIYIRVSTEEQAKEGYSISAQKKRLQAFCASQDWDVAGLYPDEGKSAKDTNRPQLQKMLKDIEDGKIDCVLVYRLDRLTRSVFDLYKLLEVFDRHDCRFKSATEVYDTTTAMGRMFITIVAALAQWERENMAERIKMGQREKAMQGKYVSNKVPLGYTLNKQTWKLYINEEATVVRKIFDMYESGYGAHSLAKALNASGVFTQFGNTWSDNTIMKTLRNRTYAGAVVWDDVTANDAHPAIIEKERFDTVQRLIKKRSDVHPRTVFSDYVFSGKIRCEICAGSVVGGYTNAGEKRYYYYRCRNRSRGNCKGSVNFPAHRVEEAFLEYLKSEGWYDDLTERTIDSKPDESPVTDEREPLKKELIKLENRKKKFQFAWADDAMEYDDFKKRMEEVRKREEEINTELSALDPEEKPKLNKEVIKRVLSSMQANWHRLDDREKKTLVDMIVTRIYPEKIGEGKNCRVIIKGVDFVLV